VAVFQPQWRSDSFNLERSSLRATTKQISSVRLKTVMIPKWEGAEEALKLSLAHYPYHYADDFLGQRRNWEERWVDLYPFLLSKGYQLRPRYDPKWVPSWSREAGPIVKSLENYEDSLELHGVSPSQKNLHPVN
jgi:hypothetical protein